MTSTSRVRCVNNDQVYGLLLVCFCKSAPGVRCDFLFPFPLIPCLRLLSRTRLVRHLTVGPGHASHAARAAAQLELCQGTSSTFITHPRPINIAAISLLFNPLAHEFESAVTNDRRLRRLSETLSSLPRTEHFLRNTHHMELWSYGDR